MAKHIKYKKPQNNTMTNKTIGKREHILVQIHVDRVHTECYGKYKGRIGLLLHCGYVELCLMLIVYTNNYNNNRYNKDNHNEIPTTIPTMHSTPQISTPLLPAPLLSSMAPFPGLLVPGSGIMTELL